MNAFRAITRAAWNFGTGAATTIWHCATTTPGESIAAAVLTFAVVMIAVGLLLGRGPRS